jgi:hypothetical protein
MAGLLIGLVCGAGELFLLTHFTGSLLSGKTLKAVGIFLGKIVLLVAALALVTLFFRQDLIWCGVGISSVLVVGSFVVNVLMRRNGKGGG